MSYALPDPGKFYEISSKSDPNLVWDVKEASQSDGAQVILWPRHSTFNQQWRFEEVGGAGAQRRYKITARHSGKSLDVFEGKAENGAQVIQFEFRGGPNQKWDLYWDNIGEHFSLRVVHSGKFLDAFEGAGRGTRLIQFQPNGQPNQYWRLSSVD
ncbi:RICIN domain-containing protein [Streptomyces sp. MUM 178J]|uniref:RICIN domain-containing protein n=1 Tax=Streptomyces sp. MUM 178J TaxID=2791991 RepID=UPI001F0332F6|nr:RICIN domain-containing protein [Streptomyces sp. MUM 178J]WRQ81655.1 RICIN domain-containing protein [Streptomyces sp. MUM 178J]